MSEEWFANKGQIIQIILGAIACIIAGIKGWPDMRRNNLFSAGALLFYLLIAIVLTAIGLLMPFYLLIVIVLMVVGALIVSWVLRVRNIRQPAIRSELDRLNPYQMLAVRQLVERGAMTGEQFADQFQGWGFPVGSLAQERTIGTVFDVINRDTTLLTQDAQHLWNLRNREVVADLLRR